MLTNRSFWAGRHFPLLEADKGATSGGGTGTEGEPKSGTETDKGKQGEGTQDDLEQVEGLNENGKAALKRLHEQREAARKEAAEAKESRDALLKEKQDREAAETKRKEKEAAEAGKFEELAKTREEERDAATADVTRLTAENDQLKAAMKAGVEAQWKELPASLQLAGKFIPEDDVLGRWNYLNDADVQKEIKESGKDTHNGMRRGPRSSGEGQPKLEPLINVGAHI